MRWQSQALVAALAAIVIGCGPRDDAARDTGAAGAPGDSPSAVTTTPGTTDTASVGGTTAVDTAGDTAADTGKAPSADTGKKPSKGDTSSPTGDSAVVPPR